MDLVMDVKHEDARVTVNVVKIDGKNLTLSKLQNLVYLSSEEWVNKIDNNSTDYKVVGLIPIEIFIKVISAQKKSLKNYISDSETPLNLDITNSIGCLIHDSKLNTLFVSYVEFTSDRYVSLFTNKTKYLDSWDDIELMDELKEEGHQPLLKNLTIKFNKFQPLVRLYNLANKLELVFFTKELLLYKYLIHLNVSINRTGSNIENPFIEFINQFLELNFEINSESSLNLLMMRLDFMRNEFDLENNYTATNNYINKYQNCYKSNIKEFNKFYVDVLADVNSENDNNIENIQKAFNSIKSKPVLFL